MLKPELVFWYKDHPEDDPKNYGKDGTMNVMTTTTDTGSEQVIDAGNKRVKLEGQG
jgi:hypothetical protein